MRKKFLNVSAVLLIWASPMAMSNTLYSGIFEGLTSRELALESSGVIDSVLVEVGQTVESGQLLMTLERDYEALEVQRRQLQKDDQSDLEALTRQQQIATERYQILKELHEEGRAVSREQLLTSELDRVRAESAHQQAMVREEREAIELSMAEAALRERMLTSPIAGTVVEIQKKAGEWLSSGESVVTVVDLSELILTLNLPETIAMTLSSDQTYQISVGGYLRAEATLMTVAPIAEAATGLIEVKFRVDNESMMLRPGMEGSVQLGGPLA